MFKKLLRDYYLHQQNKKNVSQSKSSPQEKLAPISKNILEIKKRLREIFTDCSDFVLRELELGYDSGIRILVAYTDGLVDKQHLSANILKPLMIEARKVELSIPIEQNKIIDILKENLLTTCELEDTQDFDECIDIILSGDTAIFIEGASIAFKACSKGGESRAVEQPDTETTVRGPKEGFTESLRTNTALIRRKIKTSHLKFELIQLGEYTKTDICICYLKGIADEQIINTVKGRLKAIKIDGILESGYLEEFIEDAPCSIFPTVGNSERPDKVAGKILEGRVAILCDGTPVVLTVPYLFIEALQSAEDYYASAAIATLFRLIRFMSLVVTILLPPLYVALLVFHPDVIPFKLLITISASREGIPFPPFQEALFMGIAFELLREAGVRMPRSIGQAVSIVGALILGEAAVQAGLASNPMVLITALTGIASFILPPLVGALSIARLLLLISANILGLLGILLTLGALYIYLCSLRTFGVPYMAPFSPLILSDLKDTFIRLPWWTMVKRPRLLMWHQKHGLYRTEPQFKKREE